MSFVQRVGQNATRVGMVLVFIGVVGATYSVNAGDQNGQSRPTESSSDPESSRRPATQSQSSESSSLSLARMQLYATKARALTFAFADDEASKLKFGDRPLMTWSSVGGWSGAVFVWTGKGQIQLIGCIGSQSQDEQVILFQEFVSFANSPLLETELGGGPTWRVPTRKVTPLTDIPIPASAPARRGIQMRRIARGFKVGMSVTENELERELRLLPQPLARVTETSGPVIDSAVFAFVSSKGTDPEALLLLEARRGDGDQRAWTYSVGRFTTREIWVRYKNQEVYRVGPLEDRDYESPFAKSYLYRTLAPVVIDLQGSDAEGFIPNRD